MVMTEVQVPEYHLVMDVEMCFQAPRPPLPDTEEGCEDGSVNLGEVVVAVVDRLQLVQLWESVPGDFK